MDRPQMRECSAVYMKNLASSFLGAATGNEDHTVHGCLASAAGQ